jgi:hypothetical protein
MRLADRQLTHRKGDWMVRAQARLGEGRRLVSAT